MSQKTWIYLSILVVVVLAAGIFFWWNYKNGQIKPKAATPATTLTQTFSDVPMGDPNNNYQGQYWAFNQIEAVNQKGWMIGYHEFKPDQNATRADVATAIGKAYGKTANPTAPTFSDVPTTYWAYQYIEGLKAAGWLDGYPDGTFKPDQAATRSDLAIFIASAVAGGKTSVPNPGNVTSPFSDVTTTNVAFNYIYYATQHGLMTGYPDGTFKPDQAATRADLAVTIALAKAGSDAAVPAGPATPTFDDVAVTNVAYKYIEYDNAQGYMIGYPLEFKPDDLADRAMVAVAIGRATNNLFNNPTPTFSDVPIGYWAYQEIEGLNKAGIMQGFGDGTFRPDVATSGNDAIANRATAAVVIARAKNLPLNSTGTQVFSDVKPGDFGYAEINAIYQAGYTKGCGTDSSGGLLYCPSQQITRAVLAAFIYNAFINTSTTSPSVTSPTLSPTTNTNSGNTGTGSGTTTNSAKTGAEIPLAGAGILSGLFGLRYWLGKRIR
ncbi:MAG: S-layer homology domain-containing protein [Patescibacteria group bacterium]|jgi:hypothetical protein